MRCLQRRHVIVQRIDCRRVLNGTSAEECDEGHVACHVLSSRRLYAIFVFDDVVENHVGNDEPVVCFGCQYISFDDICRRPNAVLVVGGSHVAVCTTFRFDGFPWKCTSNIRERARHAQRCLARRGAGTSWRAKRSPEGPVPCFRAPRRCDLCHFFFLEMDASQTASVSRIVKVVHVGLRDAMIFFFPFFLSLFPLFVILAQSSKRTPRRVA